MLLSVFGQSEHKCARSLRQWWARLARSPVPRSVGDPARSGSWLAVRRSIQIQDGVRTSGGPGAARRLTCASGFPSEAADIRAMGRSKAKAHGLNSGTHFDPIFGTQNGYQNRAQWANFWYPKWVPILVPILGTDFGAQNGYHIWYPFWVPILVPKMGTNFGTHFGYQTWAPFKKLIRA